MAWSNQASSMPKNWSTFRRKTLSGPTRCYLCGEGATEVDHVVPRHRGGGEKDNLKPICRRCHAHKSSMEGVEAKRRKREKKRRPEGRHPGST